jgi:predicted AAA+ superfamily ATPase
VFGRWVAPSWKTALSRPYVHIVFGARQTGKSTLLQALLPDRALSLNLARPRDRAQYARDPDRFVQQCLAIPKRRTPAVVVVDEAQAVPAIFDAVQYLYDSDKRRWRFVLCGSSARRLRVTGANLLPGRSFLHYLYPLTLVERPRRGATASLMLPLPSPSGVSRAASESFPAAELTDRLAYGDLPGVALAARSDRPALLRAYTLVYLEEEVRREALVKNWPAFARFLQFAALESGRMINYASIAREVGVSLPTVQTYYQLLEDLFIGFRVSAFTGSRRKSLLSTERFFFFDLGIRHAAAELPIGAATVAASPGPLFEQWVGIELWKRLRYSQSGALLYLRTKAGAEVDFIVSRGQRLTPIEVKWTEHPTLTDARHLLTFLDEHPTRARHGYVVCRCPSPLALHDRVTALPWSSL